MTEEGWDEGKHSVIRRWLRTRSERKQRFFYVSYIRKNMLDRLMGTWWVDMYREVFEESLNTIERYAETGNSKKALKRVREQLTQIFHIYPGDPDIWFNDTLFMIRKLANEKSYVMTLDHVDDYYSGLGMDYDYLPPLRASIYEHFGNPFRPVAFDPRWSTSTAIGLAQTMYDSREFGAMPILADALQDVGCEDDAILNHCRGDGPHVRGCWVVDLVLNKS